MWYVDVVVISYQNIVYITPWAKNCDGVDGDDDP